jgi:hypothetical protein
MANVIVAAVAALACVALLGAVVRALARDRRP